MTDELERRWDDAVEQAWTQFRIRVADRMAELSERESLVVGLPEGQLEGSDAYCQALADDGRLRVEAVSNAFLEESCALDPTQEARLRALGFEPPSEDGAPNFWLDLEQRQADQAAWVLVTALREVYRVIHPVYLDAGGLQPDGMTADTVAEQEAGVPLELDGDGPWVPHDGDEVSAMLLRAAAELVDDGRPALDDEGDLTITVGDCALWVTVAAARPRLLMSAVLAVDVADQARALEEVNLLNRREFGLTFVLQEGRVTVRRELPVPIFVLEVVREEMERILDHLERWSGDLIARVGGRAPYGEQVVHEPEGGGGPAATEGVVADRLVAALAVLRELEREDRDGLSPALLAEVFHSDRRLVMGAIEETRAQEEAAHRRARTAETEGRATLHRRMRAEARHQRDLRRRLRQALRLVVQRTARDAQEQLTLFSEDEAAT